MSGIRRGPGRPYVEGEKLKPDLYSVRPSQTEVLSALGGGNKSAGLRWLLSRPEVVDLVEKELASRGTLPPA